MEFQFWPNSQNWNLIIDLDARLIDKCARQILQCFELFGPALSWTLAKMHDELSLLKIFSQLKFDHRFGCPFDKQACTPTFATFQAIFTPFNPNLCKTARQSFTFYKFLKIKIWSYVLLRMWMISVHANFRMFKVIFISFKPNPNKTVRWSFTFDVLLRIKTWS